MDMAKDINGLTIRSVDQTKMERTHSRGTLMRYLLPGTSVSAVQELCLSCPDGLEKGAPQKRPEATSKRWGVS
jgi:hypothetical protein